MKPRAEQLRFRSTKTGNHIVDAYLEAAELGSRTLADLLSDIFDNDGEIRRDIYHFRINPATRFLQIRIGDWVGAEAGWVNVDNGQLFRERGAYTPGATYYQTDFVTYLGGRYMNIVATEASSTEPDPTQWILVSTALTAADILARLLTVDGSGSGLDADLLDGETASYYTDASNLNAGILPGARFTDASHGARAGGNLHAEVTSTTSGFMTSVQFTKLASIEPLADVTDMQNVAAAFTAGKTQAPSDDDLFGVITPDGLSLRRSTGHATKDWLKTYFDTIYFKASSILTNSQHGSRGGGELHAAATRSAAGFMTTDHVEKLEGIETSADVTDITKVRASLNASAEASPADTTMVYANDRKFSWQALKLSLKSYFDTIYQNALGYSPVNKAGDTLIGTLQGRTSGGGRLDPKLPGVEQSAFFARSTGGMYVEMGDQRTAPFGTYSITTGSSFAPLISHKYIHDNGWSGHYTFGVLNYAEKSQGAFQLLHCHPDGGGRYIWSFDGRNGVFSSDGGISTTGKLTIKNGANYLSMTDTDSGQTRHVHHNDGRIGFLKSDGSWAMHVGDGGDVWMAQFGDLNTRIERRGQDWAEYAMGKVMTIVAAQQLNWIGTYAFLVCGGDVSPNDLVPAQHLYYSDNGGVTGSGQPNGTWRCMGDIGKGWRATLFMRVS